MNTKPLKPLQIHTPLPKNEVLITCVFKYGYLDETDECFGLGHLSEHYIVEKIRQEFQPKDVWGTIDDNCIIVNILLNKHVYEKKCSGADMIGEFRRILTTIDDPILRNEQSAVTVELNERYTSTFSVLSETVRKAIIHKPPRLGRMRIHQLKNVNQFTSKDVQKCVSRILSSPAYVFIGNSDTLHLDKSQARMKTAKPLLSAHKVMWSPARTHSINTTLSETKSPIHYVAVAFPAFKTKTPLHTRYSLGFLIQEVSAQFEKNARQYGSYDTYYEYYVEQNYGFCWFGLTSLKKIDDQIRDDILKIAKAVLSDTNLSKNIAVYKKTKKSVLQKDWANSLSRHDWIVEDYCELGKVSDLTSAIKSVDLVTAATVKAAARNVFTKNNAHVVNLFSLF